MNWLDKFVYSMSEVESPSRYFYWAGMAVLAASVKKNVYFDRFKYKLYPNVYIIIVSAKSGLRKGIPLMFAAQLAESLGNLRVLNGRYTIQAALKELGDQRTLENGEVLDNAQAIILAPELKAFLVDDPAAMSILTDLQNTHEHEKNWSNTTKSSGVDILKSPCITLLGASNEALFEDFITSADMEGGFIARTFIIHESRRNVINSLMFEPVNKYPKNELEDYLKEVSKVKGIFKMGPVARLQYKDWYTKLAENHFDDRTGTLERLGDQLLKASMLISLAREPNLIIDEEILTIAINKVEENMPGTMLLALGKGNAPISGFVATILKILLSCENFKCERRALLRRGFPHISAIELDQAIGVIGPLGSKIMNLIRENETEYYEIDKETAEHLLNNVDREALR